MSGRQTAIVSRVQGNAVDPDEARSEGGVRIQAPFAPAYLVALKSAIPYTYRRWIPELHVFAIAHPYEDEAISVVEQFFDVEYAAIGDTLSLADRFWSQPPPPGEELHQRPILRSSKGRRPA